MKKYLAKWSTVAKKAASIEVQGRNADLFIKLGTIDYHEN